MFMLTFKDADLKDNAKGIVLNVTSDIDNNQISAWISDSRYSYKMVPGETHKVTLESFGNGKENGRQYYFDMAANKNIRNVRFEMTYHNTESNSALSYSLQLRKSSSSKNQMEDINLDSEVDKIDKKVVRIIKDLQTQSSRYLLKLKNDHPDKQIRVAFRFVINDVKEIEENGVLSGSLKPGHSSDMQLMITKPGHLNLTLMACSKKLVVYKAKSSYLKTKLKESEEVIGLGTDHSNHALNTTYFSYDDYISSPGPLYIRVESQDTVDTNYTLVSRMDYSSNDNLVGGLFNLLPASKFYQSEDKFMLTIEVPGPVFNKAALETVFANVTDMRISMTVILSVSTKDTHERNEAALSQFKYCSADLREKGIYQADKHFTILAKDYLDSQRHFNISIELDSGIIEQFGDMQSIVNLVQTKATIITKAKVDLYEDVDFDPVASFIEYSEPMDLPAGFVVNAVSENREIISSAASKILLLLMMVLFMVAVLFLFYIGANKLSGGYTPMSTSEALPSTAGNALEMAESTAGADSRAETNSNADDTQ